jgi:phosphoribosylglycinamide formyltransferase 1
MSESKRLAVLLSGRGSNFLAIHEATACGELGARIVGVISNRAEAPGLARARELGYPAVLVCHREFVSREEHEAKIIETLDSWKPDFILLAGYMRLLSVAFTRRYPQRIVNIHPSLLPAFPGVDAQAQAVAHGVKVTGCSVHLVDETLDGGPILVQRVVAVLEDDSAESLAARLLVEEHKAYVEAVAKLCSGFRVEGRRVIFGGVSAGASA